jgi:hypothetical protein
MMIIRDACTINFINDAFRSVVDVSRSIIDDSRVMLKIVASLTDNSIGIINNHSMFIV